MELKGGISNGSMKREIRKEAKDERSSREGKRVHRRKLAVRREM